LAEAVAERPLTQGLAELVAYWHLATRDPRAHIDDEARETIPLDPPGSTVPGLDPAAAGGRVVSLPLIVFTRGISRGAQVTPGAHL
jgi:hypothetical protein